MKINGEKTAVFIMVLTCIFGILWICYGFADVINTQEEYKTSIIAEGIVEDFNKYDVKEFIHTYTEYEIKIGGKWIEVEKEGYYSVELGDFVKVYGYGIVEVIEQ